MKNLKHIVRGQVTDHDRELVRPNPDVEQTIDYLGKPSRVQTIDQIANLLDESSLKVQLVHAGAYDGLLSSLLMKTYHHHDGQTSHHLRQIIRLQFF